MKVGARTERRGDLPDPERGQDICREGWPSVHPLPMTYSRTYGYMLATRHLRRSRPLTLVVGKAGSIAPIPKVRRWGPSPRTIANHAEQR